MWAAAASHRLESSKVGGGERTDADVTQAWLVWLLSSFLLFFLSSFLVGQKASKAQLSREPSGPLVGRGPAFARNSRHPRTHLRTRTHTQAYGYVLLHSQV
jgi:hypothetical protein